jgi:hypothetical protein
MKWGYSESFQIDPEDPDMTSDVMTLENDYYDMAEDMAHQSKKKKERSDFFRNQKLIYNQQIHGDYDWSTGKALHERHCTDCFMAKLINFQFQAVYFILGNGAKKQEGRGKYSSDEEIDPLWDFDNFH